MLQRAEETGYININCVDPLGRSALLMAIDNENLEMVELLIEHRVETKDALLHAISEEFVEAVEVLLDHEETIHKQGEPHVSNSNTTQLLYLFSYIEHLILFHAFFVHRLSFVFFSTKSYIDALIRFLQAIRRLPLKDPFLRTQHTLSKWEKLMDH